MLSISSSTDSNSDHALINQELGWREMRKQPGGHSSPKAPAPDTDSPQAPAPGTDSPQAPAPAPYMPGGGGGSAAGGYDGDLSLPLGLALGYWPPTWGGDRRARGSSLSLQVCQHRERLCEPLALAVSWRRWGQSGADPWLSLEFHSPF